MQEPQDRKLFSYFFSVKGHHVGPDGIAQPWFVQNAAQDVSVAVSEAHGFNSHWYEKNRSGWVLRRFEADNRVPWILEQHLVAETWINFRSRTRATRQYRFLDRDSGQQMGGAQAEWVYLDLRTGRPAAIPEIFDERYPVIPDVALESLSPEEEKPLKIGEARFFVRYSDLDINNHANNVATIRWMADALHEVGIHDRLAWWQIEFRTPATLGDRLVVTISSTGVNTLGKWWEAEVRRVGAETLFARGKLLTQA